MIILWLFVVSVRTSGYKLFHHFLPTKTHSFWTCSLTEGEKKKIPSCSGKVTAFENLLFSAKLLIHICKKIKASLWGWP